MKHLLDSYNPGAFPAVWDGGVHSQGMTLLDYLVAVALPPLVAEYHSSGNPERWPERAERVAQEAFVLAHAVLAVRHEHHTRQPQADAEQRRQHDAADEQWYAKQRRHHPAPEPHTHRARPTTLGRAGEEDSHEPEKRNPPCRTRSTAPGID